MKLKNISPSRIKTFDLCKFKYFLTYHCKDIELKSNWGAANGSVIHNVLEKYSMDVALDWIQELKDGFGGKLATLDKEGKLEIIPSPLLLAKAQDYAEKRPFCDTCEYVDNIKNKCSISLEPLNNLSGCPKTLFDGSKSMISKVINRYQNKIWPKILKDKNGTPIGTEYGYEILIPNTDVPIIGFMDLVIEEDPETIHIIDYKSGSWTQDYDECRNDIQVRMYSLAARREFIDDVNKKGYKYKNILLTFDYFAAKPILLSFSEEEDLDTEKDVERKIKEIESTKWIDRIVSSDADFKERRFWKCRSLCDTKVCSEQWKGRFQLNDQN